MIGEGIACVHRVRTTCVGIDLTDSMENCLSDMIKRREQLFPARMQRAQRTGHTKGKNMKEKWDSSQKLLIFSMVLAGATLVFVLIKLILEPRPNIF